MRTGRICDGILKIAVFAVAGKTRKLLRSFQNYAVRGRVTPFRASHECSVMKDGTEVKETNPALGVAALPIGKSGLAARRRTRRHVKAPCPAR